MLQELMVMPWHGWVFYAAVVGASLLCIKRLADGLEDWIRK